VLVVPSRKTVCLFWTDRIGNYQELEPYLKALEVSYRARRGVLEIIVIEQDAISYDVPKIPKTTGRNERRANFPQNHRFLWEWISLPSRRSIISRAKSISVPIHSRPLFFTDSKRSGPLPPKGSRTISSPLTVDILYHSVKDLCREGRSLCGSLDLNFQWRTGGNIGPDNLFRVTPLGFHRLTMDLRNP